MNAGVAEEWEGRGFGEQLNIDIGDVSDDVVVMIYHGEGGNSLVQEESECFCQRPVAARDLIRLRTAGKGLRGLT